MTNIRKSTRSSENRVRKLIASIGPALQGENVPNGNDIRNIFWNKVFNTFFDRLTISLEERSQGGSDDVGSRWEPLKEHTRIYKKINQQDRRTYRISTQSTGRGLLTPTQNTLWKRFFSIRFERYRRYMSQEKAKEKAAKAAWALLKEQGARTKKSELAGRRVPINKTTGRLFDSFKPNGDTGTSRYRPAREQTAEYFPGGARLGTKVPYAEDVDKLRVLVPPGHEKWVEEGVELGIQAVMEYIIGKLN